MKLRADDFRRLRGTAILCLIILGVGAAALVASRQYLGGAERERAQAEAKVLEARERLQRVRTEQENFASYLADYQRLLERGVVGDENRLGWIESVEQIRDRYGLFGVKYLIAPQKAYEPLGRKIPSLDVRATEMNLQFALLHEGQLMTFFEDLRESARGMYLLEGCRLERLADPGARRYAPRLSADCSLLWVSLLDAQKGKKP